MVFIGSIIGKYKILELVNNHNSDDIKYKVKCMKCGWIGITTYRSILKSANTQNKKCSHVGGSSIKPADKFGKYIVIKKAPANLCNNGLLVPYYKCKCTRCGETVSISSSTLYLAKNRNTYDVCKHKEAIVNGKL